MNGKTLCLTVMLLMFVLLAGACGSSGSGGGADEDGFQPNGPVDFVVHTGPGGGSDVFARATTDILTEEGLVEENWPVRNEEGGSGILGMSHMAGRAGEDEVVAAITPTWITSPVSNQDTDITLEDMTPIAGIAEEPTVMAVRDDAPYESLSDFIAAAEESPGELVQTGGSVTANDAIAGEILQQESGVEWDFLSFAGGGERISALLGGDADMMFGGPNDFAEQVEAGELKVIATIGDEQSPIFPDAPTLEDEGIEVDVPSQFRGIVGPPDMPDEAVNYYEAVFEELSQTDAWQEYAEVEGIDPAFRSSEEWESFLDEQQAQLEETMGELGLSEE